MRKVSKWLMMAAVAVLAAVAAGTGVKASTDVTQTAQTTDSITIQWTAPTSSSSAVSGYRLYLSPRSADISDYQTQVTPISVGADVTSYTFTGLSAGTEYTLYVRYDTVNASGTTDDRYLTVSTLKTAVSKVTGVHQVKWWYYIESVDFGWDLQDAADGYEYEVYTVKGKKVASSTAYSTGSASVKNNMVYKAKVRAYCEINGQKIYGDWSDDAYLFTQPMVSQVKQSKGALKITWNKVSGVNSYTVYVSTKEKKGYKKIKTVKASKRSLTVKKLGKKKIKKGKKYYVYIVANKKVGGVKYTSGKHYTYDTKKKQVHWTFD